MKHQISIVESKQSVNISFKRLTIRESLLRHLLCKSNQVMVIASSESVKQIHIKEVIDNE